MGMPDPISARRVINYRRRRPQRAIVLLAVLGVVAAIVWIRALDTGNEGNGTGCAPPLAAVGEPTPSGQAPAERVPSEVLAPNALDNVDPLPPDAVKVRVLNANGQRGQAGQTAGVLSADLGFGKAGEPANDVVYPNFDLSCHAQIRFGPHGVAGGRTLSLVVPCAELVRDTRKDDTVDLVLGAQFETLRPSPQVKEILRQLTQLAAQPPDQSGGQQGARATVDPALIAAARTTTSC